VIETAKRASADQPTTDLLRVIDGYFKSAPLEDYAGVAELRGEDNPPSESIRMGLIDWVSTSPAGM
jgi:hypothetical protein